MWLITTSLLVIFSVTFSSQYHTYDISNYCDQQVESDISLDSTGHYSAVRVQGPDDEFLTDQVSNKTNQYCVLHVHPRGESSLSLHLSRVAPNLVVIDLAFNQTIYPNKNRIHTLIDSTAGFIVKLDRNIFVPNPPFLLYFTSFIPKVSQCPTFGYFDCEPNRKHGGRCIPEYLVCDDVNNCGNNSEESRCRQFTPVVLFLLLTCMSLGTIGLWVYFIRRVVDGTQPDPDRDIWSDEISGKYYETYNYPEDYRPLLKP